MLDPQPGRVRVWPVLDDALRVVRAVDPIGWDDDVDLEAGLFDLALQTREVVRPVEDDRRLAGEDRGLGHLHVGQVAARLQVGEELDARHDVVERATVGERRGHHGGEGRSGLARITVEGDLPLVLRVLEVGKRLRRRSR